MVNNVFFGNAGDERGTPQDFFDKLNAEFHFDLDCAASPQNHKCDLWFGEGGIAFDALESDWMGGMCFLNPPYSVAGAFVKKAREEAEKGATVVMLLPVRSDTKYWHNYIWDQTRQRYEPDPADALAPGEISRFNQDMVTLHDGNWRPGVRVRFLPGRLNFELTVPQNVRDWIKSETKGGADLGSLIKATGLPKMAIERILEDQPDDCLMDAAPFPSCVVIFTKAD